MRKQHESDSDSQDSEDVEDVEEFARQYSSAVQNKNNSIQRTIDRLLATARAEAAAEDGLPHDYYDRCTAAENFYKKPVLCSAHVVGIADPVKYRKRLEAVEFFKRQQEEWDARPRIKEMDKDLCAVTPMYRSNNRQVLRNKEDWTVHLKSDGPSYPAMLLNVWTSNELQQPRAVQQRA